MWAYFLTIIKEHLWLVTLAGFVIMIWQISKTHSAASAARKAAIDSRQTLQTNLMLVDISSCIKQIEEIQVLLRNDRHESALLRVTDLGSQLVQLRHHHDFSSEDSRVEFQDILSQLSIIRNGLEQKLNDSQYFIQIVRINKKLAEIANRLNDWVGKGKYSIT